MNLWSVIRVFHGFETDWKRTRDLTGSLGRISLMSKSSGRVMREIVLEATMGFVGLFFSFSSFWFGFVEGNRRALVKRTKSKQEKRKKNNQAKKEGISIAIIISRRLMFVWLVCVFGQAKEKVVMNEEQSQLISLGLYNRQETWKLTK